MGFGLFIFFALLVVLLTNSTLERSRNINEQINRVYGPSVDALVRLRNLVLSAQMLIKHWALTESRTDAPEKTALSQLTNEELPRMIDRIDTLSAQWDKEEVALLNKCFSEMDKLFAMHGRIKEILPPYVRLQRVQRDIPAHQIAAGVKKSNLRQMAQQLLAERGGRCRCRPRGSRARPAPSTCAPPRPTTARRCRGFPRCGWRSRSCTNRTARRCAPT